jgi:putative transposase
MDGRARYPDNVFPNGDCSNHLSAMIERLWRSLKQEAVYLYELQDGFQAKRVIDNWIAFYNAEHPHTALDKRTPGTAYFGGKAMKKAA